MPREIYPTSSGFNPAMDARVAIPQPFAFSISYSTILHGTRTGHLLNPPRFTYTGSRPATSFEITDWFYRVHLLPASLALGNVVSDEIFSIGVWNAWLATSQTLDTITSTGSTGTALTGQPPPPLTFLPNQQKNWTLTVLQIGPPTLDAVYTFTFADAEAVSVTITGERITAWALTPDWSKPVNEKLAWKTDSLRAWDGSTQRRALRIAPRRNIQFSTPMTKAEKQYVENQLSAWGALSWALPIWPDGQYLTLQSNPGDTVIAGVVTTDRDFVAGGLAIILLSASQYEVVSIESFTSSAVTLSRVIAGTWPTGSKFYPVRAARLLAATRITRSTGSYADLEPNFLIVEPCDWPAATGLPMYRGAPVLEDSPDVSSSSEGSYQREAFTIDAETGALTVIDTAELGFPGNSHNWFLKGATARAAFRSLLYLLKGAQGQLWVPSYEDDLTLVTNILSGDTNIRCTLSGVGLFAGVQNRQDIRIETFAGVVYYRRVTGSIEDSPTTELLSIDSPLGAAVAIISVRRISFMALSTLASDEITIEHATSLDGIALCSTPFAAVNDPI